MIKIDGKELLFEHHSDGDTSSIFGHDDNGVFERMVISTKRRLLLTPETVISYSGREWRIESKGVDKAGEYIIYTLFLRERK